MTSMPEAFDLDRWTDLLRLLSARRENEKEPETSHSHPHGTLVTRSPALLPPLGPWDAPFLDSLTSKAFWKASATEGVKNAGLGAGFIAVLSAGLGWLNEKTAANKAAAAAKAGNSTVTTPGTMSVGVSDTPPLPAARLYSASGVQPSTVGSAPLVASDVDSSQETSEDDQSFSAALAATTGREQKTPLREDDDPETNTDGHGALTR